MTRQAWITKAGSPDVFSIREVPDPEAGPGEVVIAAEAVGINFADVLMRRGVYAAAPDLPAVPGYEVAGTVEAVGAGVESLQEGDAVLAMTQFGGYSTRVAVSADQVWKRPDGMSAAEGVCIPVNYLTAFEAMVVMGSLRRPEEVGGTPTRVLVHGAAGGVGTAAADIGRHYDAELFGTASPWKHDHARERGYDHVIDYRNRDFVEVVNELTDGRGVDLVLDPIGGDHWKRSLDVLAPTGRLCVFGMAEGKGGWLDTLKMWLKTPWWRFTPPYLLLQSVGVFGYFLGRSSRLPEVRERVGVLLDYYREDVIQPFVGRRFAFDEVAEAHAFIEDRKSIGKVVLVP